MTIEINGMAHVILTVGRFDVARDFYRKLLPQFGMKPVFDGDNFFYCVGGRTAIGIEPLRPGVELRTLPTAACRPAPPLLASPFARGAEYTHLLEAHGIAASMSRVGNPYDNAKVERFIRTLKSEEIDGTLYRDHRDARATSGRSSTRSTTVSACTPRSAIKRPSHSRPSTARGPSLPHLSPRWVFKGYGNLR